MGSPNSLSHFFRSAILLISALLSSCTLQLDEPFITQTYELGDFSSLIINGMGQVTIAQADFNSLTIVAEPSLMKNITHTVTDGKLVLGLSESISIASLDPQLSLQFFVTGKQIESIQNIGASSIKGTGLSGKTLQIRQDAMGNISLSNLNFDTVELNLNGGGVVELTGSVRQQTITMDGAASYSGGDISSQVINARLSGMSKAVVWALEILNIEANENSFVEYYGSPPGIYLGLSPQNVRALGSK